MRQCEVRGMLWLLILALLYSPLNAQSKKTHAQKLVDSIAQRHSEITGLELSATQAGQKGCATIAATEAKDLGEKCDKDEDTAMKTGEPFVEHGPDGFDVTAPLHDATGKLIGALGIDFRPQPGQTKADVLQLTKSESIQPILARKAEVRRRGSFRSVPLRPIAGGAARPNMLHAPAFRGPQHDS